METSVINRITFPSSLLNNHVLTNRRSSRKRSKRYAVKRKSDYPLDQNGLKIIELDGGEYAIPGGGGGGGVHVIKIPRGGPDKHSDQENSEELNLQNAICNFIFRKESKIKKMKQG